MAIYRSVKTDKETMEFFVEFNVKTNFRDVEGKRIMKLKRGFRSMKDARSYEREHKSKVAQMNIENNSQVNGGADERRIQVITPNEFEQLIDAFEESAVERLMFNLLYYSGIRASELLGLTIEDFDATEGTIRINKSFVSYGKSSALHYNRSNGGVRQVQLPIDLSAKIELYIKELCVEDNDNRLFPFTLRWLRRKLRIWTEKSGIRKINVYDFRRSYAAMLLEENVDIYTIKARLGYSSLNDLLQMYGHLYNSSDESKDIVEFLQSINSNKSD